MIRRPLFLDTLIPSLFDFQCTYLYDYSLFSFLWKNVDNQMTFWKVKHALEFLLVGSCIHVLVGMGVEEE